MATPLIPFTLVWLIGIWLASHIALSTLALGVATAVACRLQRSTVDAVGPDEIALSIMVNVIAVRYGLDTGHVRSLSAHD